MDFCSTYMKKMLNKVLFSRKLTLYYKFSEDPGVTCPHMLER
ncbi:hypothetical Protein YC6258_02837 [Gynuella sunshinyii YC6258]|uniref:Uncharacterized protein n=1 Tax=Gynuella sunshinyii YC6258 TaxID=1445510 RepID=A0A0C5V5Z4_9GAMM|nr:hypothetical Protein YC6258_02837 [Gynuella sunshinyii YC6258]